MVGFDVYLTVSGQSLAHLKYTLTCHPFYSISEVDAVGDDLDDGDDEETGEGIDLHSQMKLPWEGSERDYGYQEVSGLFSCMLSSVSNVVVICHRQPQILMFDPQTFKFSVCILSCIYLRM